MKEHGCGQLMADGGPCSTAGSLSPALCDTCTKKLCAKLEAYGVLLGAASQLLSEYQLYGNPIQISILNKLNKAVHAVDALEGAPK